LLKERFGKDLKEFGYWGIFIRAYGGVVFDREEIV
jgi:hypothetical protein